MLRPNPKFLTVDVYLPMQLMRGVEDASATYALFPDEIIDAALNAYLRTKNRRGERQVNEYLAALDPSVGINVERFYAWTVERGIALASITAESVEDFINGSMHEGLPYNTVCKLKAGLAEFVKAMNAITD